MLASACRESGVVRAGRVSSGLRGEAPSGSVLLCCPVSPMQAAGLPRPVWGTLLASSGSPEFRVVAQLDLD